MGAQGDNVPRIVQPRAAWEDTAQGRLGAGGKQMFGDLVDETHQTANPSRRITEANLASTIFENFGAELHIAEAL